MRGTLPLCSTLIGFDEHDVDVMAIPHFGNLCGYRRALGERFNRGSVGRKERGRMMSSVKAVAVNWP